MMSQNLESTKSKYALGEEELSKVCLYLENGIAVLLRTRALTLSRRNAVLWQALLVMFHSYYYFSHGVSFFKIPEGFRDLT